MQPLDRTLRRELERTIQQARDTAETAARTALTQLGIGEAKPYDYLTEAQRELRRRLRAHGRQLGDERKVTGAQDTERLLEEVAYEHWHRMLFARFLAENNLLMYPDPQHPVPVTLAECEELAEDENANNGWELAARFAGKMLPQIFRVDSPVLELTLPPEHQQRLESLLAKLPAETFTASDALGWVYQFWQAKKKDDVNRSEVKIGARELPAVTQLFTEPYMVSFLLDNSLGAWWAARRLTSDDLQNAESEAELRQKASIPGVPLDYLRFVRDETSGAWTPAAGTFEAWPQRLSELKTLDPCCGSGHFLVSALLMLAPMRAELEGLTPRQACDAVLRDNLYGLELDQRCVEIAAFALALTAWRYADYRTLPELQVACVGLAPNTPKKTWVALAGENRNLQIALEELYEQFVNAPILGSLIDPAASLNKGTLFELSWNDVAPLLKRALAEEQDHEKREMGIVAEGITKAAELLSSNYHLVMTNPPYLVKGKQSENIQEFSSSFYRYGDADLATVFIKRFELFLYSGGTHVSVTPLNWLFLKSYKNLRTDLLSNLQVNHVSRIGSGATAKASWDVLRALAIVTKTKAKASSLITGIEASSPDEENRASELIDNPVAASTILEVRETPDARIVLNQSKSKTRLETHARSYQGIATADYSCYGRQHWELQLPNVSWELQQSTTRNTTFYSGLEYLLYWQQGNGALSSSTQARIQGLSARKHSGIAVTQTRSLPVTVYYGEFFDNNVAAIVPINPKTLAALWCYFESPQYSDDVRKLDEKLGVTNSTLVKVPFDLDHWQRAAEERYPNDLPKPFSNDPTQWIFHGHPCASVVWNETSKRTDYGTFRTDNTVLQVAVARLLSYRWPAELDEKMELADEQRALVNKSAALFPFADRDGVVCIPPVRGERPAADRLLNLLAAAYGDAWSNDVLSQLLGSADHTGKSLDTWLRDKFFTQHCALFGQRPFIWHIWDGLRDGFSALVNYHNLDYKLLESIIYTYLGDWIRSQKRDVEQHIDGAQERLAAAEALQKRLLLILTGEEPYDIFVRWKPLHEQPIGWNPDINDGVRLNIRPFMSVPDIGKRGAGVLRDKPRIDWSKDRGKDVESSFWYPLFKGDRINDHHLSLAEKQAARAKRE